ncbi:hypothetical protein SMC26_10010 [Actinomadura fulvescens]|uniref:Uncharacterized protein n=1 Tax=Actinomadura fulvescens TaxID=46160 RepID=A0ABP6CFY0_9ACTN
MSRGPTEPTTPSSERSWGRARGGRPSALADPDDGSLHEVRSEVYTARADAEPSMMATGVYSWSANESRRLAGRPRTTAPASRA